MEIGGKDGPDRAASAGLGFVPRAGPLETGKVVCSCNYRETFGDMFELKREGDVAGIEPLGGQQNRACENPVDVGLTFGGKPGMKISGGILHRQES